MLIKLCLGSALIAAFSMAYSMRCGTHLINEGDNIARVIQLCGEPSYNNYSMVVYSNKDGDGMDYSLHVNASGIVDSITFSRGE